MRHISAILGLLLLAVSAGKATAADTVRIDGSSTVFPISEAVAEEFQAEVRGKVRVTIGVSGTGGGFKKFCRGDIDISNASRTIKPSEVSQCEEKGIGFIELPVAYDGIAVMVNPKNDWVDYLTVDELRKLWTSGEDKAMRWNDVRPGWPDKEIHLFGPGIDSGTFDYFKSAIVGKKGDIRGDFTASEDDNVLVQGISRDALALGFFGVAYYEENKDVLKLIGIDDGNDSNGKGPVKATYDNVLEGTYQPLARPIFIYVADKSAKNDFIGRFVNYYLDNSAFLSKDVGYIALPDGAYEAAKARFNKGITGSIFGSEGETVGVKVEELLKKGLEH